MALNKNIIKKVRAKTDSEPEVGDYLLKLLEFESDSPGWWKPEYRNILEKACEEERKDENN